MDPETKFFLQPSPERNFAFIVQERKLWVSKETLALYSPVFQRMFYGDFKESNDAISAQELPEKKFRDFVQFLQCLIPCPVRGRVGRENFLPLLQLADEYEVEDLKRRCNKMFLTVLEEISRTLQGERFFAYYDAAVLYRYEEVIKTFLPMAAYHCRKNGMAVNVAEYPANVKSSIQACIDYRRSIGQHEVDHSAYKKDRSCLCKTTTGHFKCGKCDDNVCPLKHLECNSYHNYKCRYRFDKVRFAKCLCGYKIVENII